MNEINLISLIQAAEGVEQHNHRAFCENYAINISLSEIDDLKILIQTLINNDIDNNLFEHFFVGYVIPQISKEFDLLRIGNNSVVNIELKRTSTEGEIKKQLIKNRYYLNFLDKPIFSFTYVSEENSLYQLIEDRLEIVSFDILIDKIQQQDINRIKNINTLFNPSCYLVSPFNSTERFLSGQYFFTQQQIEFTSRNFKVSEFA